MIPVVDDLVGRSAGTATAELDRRSDGLTHAPTPPTPSPASLPSRAREHAGPVRRMVLAATAGALVGAFVASGTLYLRDDSGSSTTTPQTSAVQSSASTPAAQTQGDIAAILAKDVPAVVAITTDGGPGLGQDPSSDLAVLKVDSAGLAAIDLGDSNLVQVGDDVVAIGNALDLDGGL